MNKWSLRVAALVILLLLCVAGWRFFFPPPDKVIRRRLADLAKVASFGPKEGQVAKAMNAQNAAGYFTEDTEIIVELAGYGSLKINGRNDLFQALLAARTQLSMLEVQFLDVNVAMAGNGKGAMVDLTAKGKVPGDRDIQVMELKLTLKLIDGKWLIRRVETVKTLSHTPERLRQPLPASLALYD
jgi:hypothetical protein